MKLSTKLLAGGTAIVVLAAGAIGAATFVSAQTPGSTATPAATPAASPQAKQTLKQQFLGDLAQNLNISTDQLTSALKKTELQTVDSLLANHRITQAQATRLQNAINSGKNLGLGRLLAANALAKMRKTVRREIVTSAAAAIGIKPADLVTELKGGKSIAEVAAQHNVSLDSVKAKITSDAKTKLDNLVASGKMKQAREDRLMQLLYNNVDKILNAKKGG